MRAVVLAVSVACASAFMAPMPMRRARDVTMSAAKLIGADVETGGMWDPLGLSKISERNKLGINPHIQWLQESEIKHGRIAMLAFLGVIVPKLGINVPTYPVEPDWTLAFSKALVNNPLGMAQIALAVGIIEGHYDPSPFWTGEGTREPGAFGFDPLGFSKDPTKRERYALSEIKNGRLAMIAMAGFASEHLIPGSVPLLSGQGF